jgi:hypothetical protein
MKSVLCPTCGCSLVRLGISRKQAVHATHDHTLYFFCCDGCAETFRSNPDACYPGVPQFVVTRGRGSRG